MTVPFTEEEEVGEVKEFYLGRAMCQTVRHSSGHVEDVVGYTSTKLRGDIRSKGTDL